MFDCAHTETGTPTFFDERDARRPIVYRQDTGATLPKAFWIMANLFREMDDLAVQYLRANFEGFRKAQEILDQDLDPVDGDWIETGDFGDGMVWVSTAEVEARQALEMRWRDLTLLMSIYDELAPDTTDARIARAALETANLRAWDTGPGAQPPRSYVCASQWLAAHVDDAPDPAFRAFRAEIQFLIESPLIRKAALDEVEREFELM